MTMTMLRWFLLLAFLVTTALGMSVNTNMDGWTGVSNTTWIQMDDMNYPTQIAGAPKNSEGLGVPRTLFICVILLYVII